MKSMQRKFGTFMKRSENDADVQTVLDEFKAVDGMLDLLLRELTSWRNGWEDMLKLQYDTSEAFVTLYKPIEPIIDSETRHQPVETPPQYMQKCLGLQKEYSEVRSDLGQELVMITNKLIRPIEDAKRNTKLLHKTVKHRENMKLDYERFLGRAEHVQKKEIRTQKEEVALAAHEAKLAQARIDYQTADEHVRQTFPPVSEAVLTLIPPILASMIMLQTTLVAQLYTVTDAYTKRVGLPNPAPSDAAIVSAWESEFTTFRKELESGLVMIARGKAVNMGMGLPLDKDRSTVTGLGIRNKIMNREKSSQSIPIRPANVSRQSSNQYTPGETPTEDDAAPPKPPRPSVSSTPSYSAAGRPRIPSTSSNNSQSNGHYDQKPPPPYSTSLGAPSPRNLPYPDTPGNGTASIPASGSLTPGSRYLTPVASHGSNAGADYFSTRRTSAASQASTPSAIATAAAAAAAKKKPAPPVPAKRIPSSSPAPLFVVALYDFAGQNPGDLAFREGDRIRVVNRSASLDDWWDGELAGRVGAFPANYVQL